MSEQNARPRHRMHGPGGGMMPGEKAKDFRGRSEERRVGKECRL